MLRCKCEAERGGHARGCRSAELITDTHCVFAHSDYVEPDSEVKTQ